MEYEFFAVFNNPVLLPAAASWFAAQLLKGAVSLIVYRRFDIRRFTGSGGMPSSHSAMVTALALSTALNSGFDSPVFGVAVMFAFVVMYDAAGVRRAAGRQAKKINEIMEHLLVEGKGITQEQLKELLGHSPLEVIAGAILGATVALLFA